MNKGYTCINGKVIISDENGNHKEYDYMNNINEILVKENVIENIEDRIKALNKIIKDYDQKNSAYKILFGALIGALTSSTLVIWTLTGQNPFTASMDTVYGSIDLLKATGMISTGVMPFAALFAADEHYKYKISIKKKDGIISEIKFLYKELKIEKSNLRTLKKENTIRTSLPEEKSEIVNDKQKLDELKEKSKLYFMLGYNNKKYNNYYNKNKLDEKLKNTFNEDEIKIAKDYYKKKNKTLTLKK